MGEKGQLPLLYLQHCKGLLIMKTDKVHSESSV
jgi:hypothetical protein